MNRRYFMMGAATAASAMKSSMMASPNDTVRVACVGVRGQGNAHLKQYAKMKNVEIAAICDVDESVLDQRLAETAERTGKKPDRYWDLRKLLEDKSIDAISIATPNHNHTLQAIWAMQAGKDVYVEKPCAHDMFEARQIVKAAHKYNRVVQHGTNSRSNPGLIEAVQKLRDGVVGDVYHARGLCYKWRDTIGHKPVEPVPAGVHYDEWQGPAQLHAFTRNRFHYNFHWFWDYGNGDLGNQGIHELDIARWGLGVKYPHKVSAIGGHFMFDDDQETPNTLSVSFEFRKDGKPLLMTFEVRHWITNHEAEIEQDRPPSSETVGNIFYGTKGYLACEWYTKYWTRLGKTHEPGPSGQGGASNWQNFIDVVRSRKLEDRNAPIEEGAISVSLLHLANISYRLGRTLEFDSDTMQVVGDAQANAMFKRNYRAPYVVPENV